MVDRSSIERLKPIVILIMSAISNSFLMKSFDIESQKNVILLYSNLNNSQTYSVYLINDYNQLKRNGIYFRKHKLQFVSYSELVFILEYCSVKYLGEYLY